MLSVGKSYDVLLIGVTDSNVSDQAWKPFPNFDMPQPEINTIPIPDLPLRGFQDPLYYG